MMKRCLLLLVGALIVPGSAGGSEGADLELVEALLMDVGIRGDIDGLLAARTRLEGLAGDHETSARVNYDLGLATLQLLFSGYQPDRKSEVIQAALGYLDRAIEKEKDFAPAHALSAMCHAFQMQIEPDQMMEILGKAQQKLKRAEELAKDDPRVMFVSSMFKLYGPGTRELGIQGLEKTIGVLEERHPRTHRLADWWHVSSLAWTAQALLFADDPDLEKSRRLLHRSLELRPDFEVARGLLQQTQPLRMLPGGSVPSGRWTTLVEDPPGDGKIPSSVDGKSLAYLYDHSTQHVWLKYAFHQDLDPRSFGVNLVVDNDRDETNGSPWWGTNKEFRFDRLVTVWVTRMGDEHYRGIVGVCDAQGAAAMRMTNLGAHNVKFAHLPDENAVVIGIERSQLGNSDAIRLIGAVGTHQMWNDDIGDQKAVKLELRARE